MKKIISLLISTVMILSSFASVSVMADTNLESGIPFYFVQKEIWNINFDNGEKFDSANNVNDWLRDSSDDIINGTQAGDTALSSTLRVDAANGGTHEITSSPTDSSNRVLKLALDGTAGGSSKIAEWQSKINDFVIYSYDFYIETLPANCIIGYVYRNGTAYAHDESIGIKSHEDDGKVTIYTRDSGRTISRDIEKNKWHNLKLFMKYDSGKKTYTQYSYIDNTVLAEYEKPDQDSNIIDKVVVQLSGDSAGCVYIDNMHTYRATEEGTCEVSLAHSLGENFADIYEGDTFNLISSTNAGNSVSKYEILSSDDGVNYTEISNRAKTVSTYAASTKYYKAKYTFDNGESVQSTPFKLYGKPATLGNIWNIDFNEGYSFESVWGNELKKDGEVLTSVDSVKFVTSKGDGSSETNLNTVSIGSADAINSDGTEHGKALILSSKSPDRNACNADNIYIEKDIDHEMVISYDIAITSAASVIPLKMNIYKGDNKTNEGWINGTALSNGKFVFHNVTTAKTMNPGKWYNIKIKINTVDKEIKYYVNNELLVTKTGNDCPLGVKKIGISANKGLTDLYVDNIKIYNAEPKATSFGLKGVSYKADGSEVLSMTKGNLSASVTVSSTYGTAEGFTCIYAVYDNDGTLKKVVTEPVTFDAKETRRTLYKDLGSTEANSRAKVMIWDNMENLTPKADLSELNPR